MAKEFDFAFKGVKVFRDSTKELEDEVAKATIAGIKANQNKLKVAIRANLRGEPRWTQKGKNRITGPNFQVQGTMGQHNFPRDGGPGRMTGVLYKGVGGVRRPRQFNGTYYGGVCIGAKPNNVKKGVLEAKFPYFRPAVEKVGPFMGATNEKGWLRAMNKMRGIL